MRLVILAYTTCHPKEIREIRFFAAFALKEDQVRKPANLHEHLKVDMLRRLHPCGSRSRQGHPFWTTPNLIITAHTAAPSLPSDLAGLFIENYCRLPAGEASKYRVDFESRGIDS